MLDRQGTAKQVLQIPCERRNTLKAKDLCEMLMRYPDFEVRHVFSERDDSEYGMTVRVFDARGIGDIDHSDKLIQIDFEEV